MYDRLPRLFTTQRRTDLCVLVLGLLKLYSAVAAHSDTERPKSRDATAAEGSRKSRQRPDQEIPQQKISETFLDFADPIVETLPEDVSAAQMEHALKIAYTVWNAMVLQEVKGDRHSLDLIQAAVGQDPDVTTLVSTLMERTRTRFGSDHRLIGIYHIIEKHGELILRADVRAIPA